MAVDIKQTLQPYLSSDGKSINITPAIQDAFGAAVGVVIQEIFSASVSVDGANFTFTGDQDKVTITGTGNAAPLVSQFNVTLTYAVQETGASMDLAGSITSQIPISSAWPSQLSGAPFNALDLTAGTVALNVDFGDTKFTLDVSATMTYDQQSAGTGIVQVQYDGSLGFLAGVMVTGQWTPVKRWPELQNLKLAEAGLFLSTITLTDLTVFQSLNPPYLPAEIDPGLTLLAELALEGDIAALASFFPSGTTLDLLANIPISDPAATTLTATLKEPATNSSFQFTEFSLSWQLNSQISLTISAQFTPEKNQPPLTLTGDGKFVYGGEPSLEADITLTTGGGSWAHPFGVQNVTIDSFSFGFSLSEEGIDIAAQGSITVGTGTGAVILTLGIGILDFEAPSYLLAELQAADKGKQVTIPELVQDFIPSLNLSNFPLLNQITIGELELLIVAAPIEVDGKSYQPGVGVTGDISFFGYDLDFAFSLISSPFAIQAKGMLSDNCGPIVISAAGINIVTISDATGKLGPSACIDTTGGGYCSQSNYFTATAGLELLGLVKASLLIQADSSGFMFDATLDVSTVFTNALHAEFYPQKGDIAASLDTTFNPGQNLTIPAWGPFPGFSIPLPNFELILGFGTVLPSQPIGPQNYMPSQPPYFYFYFDFTWGIVDFTVSFAFDWGSISGIFTNFGSWLVNWVENNAGTQLADIAKDATEFAKLLVQIGWIFFDILEAMIKTFVNLLVDAIVDIIDAIINPNGVCAVSTGDSNMNASTSQALYLPTPSALADLTATDKGQTLLYHYYLNKPEIDQLLTPGSPTAEKIHQSVAANAEQGVIPAAIALAKAASEHGSPDLKASAAEVLPLLEPHQNKSYAEFLTALAA